MVRHDPVRHWLVQRISGAALAFLGVWFVVSLPVFWHASAEEIGRWLADPWRFFAVQAMIVFLFWHGKLGIDVIIDDYLRGRWHRVCRRGAALGSGGAMIAAAAAVIHLALR